MYSLFPCLSEFDLIDCKVNPKVQTCRAANYMLTKKLRNAVVCFNDSSYKATGKYKQL
ncbi:hypothetical protein COLO4_06180 [Corchorus olitorius]|uniref:Uncharacterized protein n=1 Tax=Corchorus olitorius TaxID=93759 RepID=A0A1R3KNR7_9ROSI|nr:hypothetical protein COLO4_06180 [Corchorus olitorius]